MSIEDPFDQDDWEHYAKMTTECGDSVQIVGDDLLVTNPKVCDITRWSYQFYVYFPCILFLKVLIFLSLSHQRVAKAIAEKSCNALLLKVFSNPRL